jgi:hypothetical protein
MYHVGNISLLFCDESEWGSESGTNRVYEGPRNADGGRSYEWKSRVGLYDTCTAYLFLKCIQEDTCDKDNAIFLIFVTLGDECRG